VHEEGEGRDNRGYKVAKKLERTTENLQELHLGVFHHLEENRTNPAFIRYACDPGILHYMHIPRLGQPLPEEWALDYDLVDRQEEPHHQVRKIAKLYAYLGEWRHAFQCLSLPLYKQDSAAIVPLPPPTQASIV